MEIKFSFLRLIKVAEVGEITLETDDLTEENITKLLNEKTFKRFLTNDVEVQEEQWKFLPFVEATNNVKSVT